MKKSCVIIAMLFVVTASGWANMLTNGGYESLGWTFYNNSGRTDWSVRSGFWGGAVWGWDALATGGCWQDVACPGTGVYTFSVFIFQERNFNPSVLELKLEGFASGVQSETPTVVNHIGLPRDGFWHEVFVTATVTNPATTTIRPVISLAWNGSGIGKEGVLFDDASLYAGAHTGSVVDISNPSFELGLWNDVGPGYTNAVWRGSQWAEVEENYESRRSWGNRSGTNGVALFGWGALTNATVQISQPIYSGTGTYSFSVWMSRENAFNLSNMQLRIEWYDATCSNKVQADSVTNFLVQDDNFWRQYFVNGTCTSNNLYEIRPVIQPLWNAPSNSGGNAARIDDARWMRGPFDGYSIQTNWGYHCAVGSQADMEAVPGTNVGTFLQVNYNTHTNTFYVLVATNLAKYTAAGDGPVVLLRTAYMKPEDNNWVDKLVPMTRAGTVTLSSASPFHGIPAAGTQVVDLYTVSMQQPTNISGAFYATNVVRLYYAPIFQSTNGIIATDVKYLVRANGQMTNHLGQVFAPEYANHDYYYDNFDAPTWAAFTNGGFSNPSNTITLADSGWFGAGNLERPTWVYRSPSNGLVFQAWNPGSARVFQNVATTGGVYSFSSYVRVEQGVTNLLSLSLRMAWYTADDKLLQVDERSLLDTPRTNDRWFAASVIGDCRATNVAYVQLSIQGEYGPSDAAGETIAFDDAQFLPLTTTLQNPSFESPLDNSGWFNEGNCNREGWGGVSGSYLLGFHGWASGRARAYQDVATTGGVLKFTTHAKIEPGATNVSSVNMRMEWFKGDGTSVQTNILNLLESIPHTPQWEEVYIAAACNQPGVQYVRVSVDGEWGLSTHAENKSIMFDDMTLVAISTNLRNSAFDGGGELTPDWYSWSKEFARIEGWGGHSGTNLMAFRGWIRNTNDWFSGRYETTAEQPVSVVPGKYAFSVWIARDLLFDLTNAEMRIEWYGSGYPNKLQADTVLPLTIPAGSGWTLYTVTGECVNAGLKVAVPLVFAQWTTNSADSLKLDDAAFTLVAGGGVTDGIPDSWWDLYGITGVDRVAAGDYDDDGYLNIEEYAGQTDPSDILDFFPEAAVAQSEVKAVISLVVNPTSAQRLYDAYWKTNLMDYATPWQSYGLSVTGHGGSITLTVTNNDIGGKKFFRTGATLLP